MVKILIVDKQRSIRNILREKLEFEGYTASAVESLSEALEFLEKNPHHIVISDDTAFDEYITKYDNISGKYVVIVMAESRSVDSAVQYIRAGAYDYVAKPLNMNHLLETIKHTRDDLSNPVEGIFTAIPRVKARAAKSMANGHSAGCDFIIGNSTPIMHVKNLIEKVAPSEARVMITGPNGTGKELVAKALHQLSQRKDAPFIEVNCAAIPSELIESELFGHEKGAFTSAIKQRKGKFEQANGGTLFLDEIGDMSLSAQAKVLRALQENRITRVGGDNDIQVDVRIVAATNKDLKDMIHKGDFREDLYHRLSVILIQVPPLCERLDDIPLLVEHFLGIICKEYGVEPKTVEQEALKELQTLQWTGNIRELRNVVERLIILGGSKITSDDVRMYAINAS